MHQDSFSEAIRKIVPKIPCGKVINYGAVARLVGSPNAARSVANAMGTPGTTVGWHRVVCASGRISARLPNAYGSKQRELLECEGIVFDDWRVVGFDALTCNISNDINVLAFDTGIAIVGILDVNTGAYTAYRDPAWTAGATRLLECDGVIVSFNGNRYDLYDLARIIGAPSPDDLNLRGIHCDMRRLHPNIAGPLALGPSPYWVKTSRIPTSITSAMKTRSRHFP